MNAFSLPSVLEGRALTAELCISSGATKGINERGPGSVGLGKEYQELYSVVPGEASHQSLVRHQQSKGFCVVYEQVEDVQGAELRLVMLLV